MIPENLTFHTPEALWLLLLLPLLGWNAFVLAPRRRAALRFPPLAALRDLPGSWAQRFRHLPDALRIAALALLVVALARPQAGEDVEEVDSIGLDIALVLDVSTSMRALDFQPRNRLHVSKQVLEDFIGGRPHDRISLVVFAGRSFTQCPPTLDHDVLVSLLRQVDFGQVQDGTAIGTGILNATNRLRGEGSQGRVMILLTDGVNNSGEVAPVTAARAAAALGIRIYTIGVGREGEHPLEVDDPLLGRRIVTARTEIDEPMLREISALTGGRYFRAQNTQALEAIYSEIDGLEKAEVRTTRYTLHRELFPPVAAGGFALAVAGMLLGHTRFRRGP